MDDTLRKNAVKKIHDRFPTLRGLIAETIAEGRHVNPPLQLQVKGKTADMIQAVVSGSNKLYALDLANVVAEELSALGHDRVESIYYGFVKGNEKDKSRIFSMPSDLYVHFGVDKMPLMDCVLLFLLICALEEDPIQICTRAHLTSTRRWLCKYRTYLAHKLRTVLF